MTNEVLTEDDFVSKTQVKRIEAVNPTVLWNTLRFQSAQIKVLRKVIMDRDNHPERCIIHRPVRGQFMPECNCGLGEALAFTYKQWKEQGR